MSKKSEILNLLRQYVDSGVCPICGRSDCQHAKKELGEIKKAFNEGDEDKAYRLYVARLSQVSQLEKYKDRLPQKGKLPPQQNKQPASSVNLNARMKDFPSIVRNDINKMVKDHGADILKSPSQARQVEVMVSGSIQGDYDSAFGHVAVKVGDVVIGRGNQKWVYESTQNFHNRSTPKRDTTGYVMSVTPAQRNALLNSIYNKTIENKAYGLTDRSCSNELISSFGDAGLNIVDPRWSLGAVFSPKDIMNFLENSGQVRKKNLYPKKK